jgi:acyl carrier protein
VDDMLVFALVTKALRRSNRNIRGKEIRIDSSILDDLGFDSLRFIDLTLAIEDELGVADFPMQAWYDAEMEIKDGRRPFTVASLVTACQRALQRDQAE